MLAARFDDGETTLTIDVHGVGDSTRIEPIEDVIHVGLGIQPDDA